MTFGSLTQMSEDSELPLWCSFKSSGIARGVFWEAVGLHDVRHGAFEASPQMGVAGERLVRQDHPGRSGNRPHESQISSSSCPVPAFDDHPGTRTGSGK